MEEKFIKRYSSFTNSLDVLSEAKTKDLSDSFILSGISAKFCITFDLSWKVMKDILTQYYAINDFVTGSPKDVLRASYNAKLISDDTWMEMLKVRNNLIHDYNGDILKKYCSKIISTYIKIFYDFKDNVDKLLNK